MCVTLYIDDEYIADMKSLGRKIGFENIVLDDLGAYTAESEGSCLCPLNVEATAEKSGYSSAQMDVDPWEFEWKPITPSHRAGGQS